MVQCVDLVSGRRSVMVLCTFAISRISEYTIIEASLNLDFYFQKCLLPLIASSEGYVFLYPSPFLLSMVWFLVINLNKILLMHVDSR